MIKFSIITCTYNASEVLQRTLNSVMSQTWGQIEHIIVDGASKDSTVAMAEAYRRRSAEEETEHDIIIKSEPDRGLYDAMNKGLQLANDVNERSDGRLPAVLYGDTNIVDNNGELLRPRRLAPPDNLTWRSFKHGMLVCHQAFYVRTDIAKAEPYNLKYRFSADVDWCIRVMKRAEKEGLPLLRLPEVVVNYLDGGMTNKNHRASLIERFNVMSHHYGLMPTIMMHIWFVARAVLKK